MRSMRTWLKYGLLWLAFFAPQHAWGQEIDAMAYLDKAISVRAQHPDSVPALDQATAVLAKPFANDDLRRMVRELLA